MKKSLVLLLGLMSLPLLSSAQVTGNTAETEQKKELQMSATAKNILTEIRIPNKSFSLQDYPRLIPTLKSIMESQQLTPDTKALFAAIINNDEQEVERLIPLADVNARDEYNNPPMFVAIAVGNPKIITALLKDKRLDLSAVKPPANDTALHVAINRRAVSAVKLLLADPRVDINYANRLGFTPLHRAVYARDFEILGLVLADPRLKVNDKDNKGLTALHIAVQRNSSNMVKMLLSDPRVNMDLTDKKGRTAYDLAVEGENSEILKLFEAKKAGNL